MKLCRKMNEPIFMHLCYPSIIYKIKSLKLFQYLHYLCKLFMAYTHTHIYAKRAWNNATLFAVHHKYHIYIYIWLTNLVSMRLESTLKKFFWIRNISCAVVLAIVKHWEEPPFQEGPDSHFPLCCGECSHTELQCETWRSSACCSFPSRCFSIIIPLRPSLDNPPHHSILHSLS